MPCPARAALSCPERSSPGEMRRRRSGHARTGTGLTAPLAERPHLGVVRANDAVGGPGHLVEPTATSPRHSETISRALSSVLKPVPPWVERAQRAEVGGANSSADASVGGHLPCRPFGARRVLSHVSDAAGLRCLCASAMSRPEPETAR